jgi:hypothetical protein
VGLVALNLIGEPQAQQAPGPLPYLDTQPQQAGDSAYYNYAAAEVGAGHRALGSAGRLALGSAAHWAWVLDQERGCAALP